MTPEVLRILKAALAWRELETEMSAARCGSGFNKRAAEIPIHHAARIVEAKRRLRDAVDLLPREQRRELQ